MKKIQKKLKSTVKTLKQKLKKLLKVKQFGGPKTFVLDLLRIYLGAYLFYKGLIFMFFPKLLAYWIESGQLLVLETLVAHYVVLAHVFGGLLLLLGLATRFAALLQIPILIGAVYFVAMKEGGMMISQNMDITLLILFLLIITIFVGPSKLSMDHYIEKSSGSK